MLNGKMAMAMAAAMVLAALYGCSSSSGIKNDRDRAEAELAQAIMDHAAALEAADADKMRALEAAAEAAAADKTMALAAAAMAAEEAEMMALAAAAMAAEEAEMMALAAAAMAAEEAEMMALAAAAMAAAADKTMALAAAANLHGEALMAAIAEAEMAEMRALEAAAMAAAADKTMALEAAAMAAAADKTMALAAAAMAAAADKTMALEAAAMAAEEAETMALEAAAMAAEEAQRVAVAMALAEAGVGASLDAYNRANTALHLARTASSGEMWSVENAGAFKSAADAALLAAQKAKAAADTNGNVAQSAMAQTAVDSATQAVLDATDAVQYATTAAAITKVAIAHAMAINVNPATSDVQPFDSAMAEGNVTIAAVREAVGEGGDVKVTLTIPVGAEDADATSFEASGTPSRIRNWDGSLHMREDDKAMSSEAVSVYTDINPPDDEEYESYYEMGDRLGVTGSADATTGELVLDKGAVTDAAALYSAAMFPTAGDQIKTYVTDDPDTEDVDESEQRMFPGSFNSVPGIYACTGVDCEATATATGTLRTLTGEWTFTPDDLKADVKGVIPDADYLYFGYWLKTTEDVAGNKYTIQTFSGGVQPFAGNQIDMVEGKAVYSGPAAGIYVKKGNFNDAGEHGTATNGRFTAMANLTATFDGGPTTAVANWFSIKGTVKNFMDGTENLGWMVELEKADLGTRATDGTGTLTDHTSTFNGEATGENGRWSGAFFGPSATEAGVTTPMPSGVAGEFTAHFSNGHVAGAFAAE